MGKFFHIFFCCCVGWSTAIAQDSLPKLTPFKEWAGSFKDFEVDHLGNIYLLTANQQLKKINAKGDSLAVFNDVKSFGNLSRLDVSNPLKVLLYYKQFTTAVVLDRFLNLNNQINLRKQGWFLVQHITASFDNNYWLFDEQKFTLRKINDAGSTLLESNDFRQVFGMPLYVTELLDREGQVFLNTKDKGVFAFDYYGTYKTTYDLPGLTELAVEEGWLYGFAQNKLIKLDTQSGEKQSLDLPSGINNAKKHKVVKGKLYVLMANGLSVFNL